MITVPFFDEIIAKSNISGNYDKKQLYIALASRVVDPTFRRRSFYEMVPSLTSRQHIDLYTNLTDNLNCLLWNQYLCFLKKYNITGVRAISCSKYFRVEMKDIQLLKVLNYVDYTHIQALDRLQAPLTHREVENFLVSNLSKSMMMIRNKAFKKLSFLQYNNSTDMENLVGYLKSFALCRLYEFLPLYRNDDLGRMLNTSLSREVINVINFYTSEKRKQSTERDENGDSHNILISLNGNSQDGESVDLLNIIGDRDTSNVSVELAGDIAGIYNNFVHTESKNPDVLFSAKVEVMKILKNDNPAFLVWYNNTYKDTTSSIYDIYTEKNFLTSMQNYLKLKKDQFMQVLAEIKPFYQELMEG